MNKKGCALITGGAKRVGREIAINLAKKGYDLVISYKSSKSQAQDLSKLISKEYGSRCEILACDLSNRKGAEDLLSYMLENHPNWNLLINNASIFNKSNFLDQGFDEMDDNFNLHLISPIILSKGFATNLSNNSIAGANIINLVDKMITRSKTSYFYYLLSKQYLAQLTKMMAMQLAPDIRVNAIAPWAVLPEEFSGLDKTLQNPLKIKGDPLYVVQSLNYILENEFITGQILFTDGGSSLAS